MNQTKLAHTVIDSTDYLSLIILDNSLYNPDITPTNSLFEIFAPNFHTAKVIEYTSGNNTIVNSTVMGWTASYDLKSLQDGIWTIKQSTCPNDTLKLTSYHFRIVNTKALLIQKILEAKECCDEDEVIKYYYMLQDLEIAKYMAENCGDFEKAKVLFNSIFNKLTKCPTC